jgi:hypothetical protein
MQSAMAAVASYSSSYSFTGYAFGPHPPDGDAGAFGFSEWRNAGPAQFDPSLGTLTSVEYHLADSFEVAANVDWEEFPALPGDVPGFVVDMWAAYRVPNRPNLTFGTPDGGTTVTQYDRETTYIYGGMIGPMGATLSGSWSGTYSYDAATESLSAFIGTSDIDSRRYINAYMGNASQYLYDQVWGSFTGVYDGDATVTYTYTPFGNLVVPEPKLMGFAVALGFMWLVRRR